MTYTARNPVPHASWSPTVARRRTGAAGLSLTLLGAVALVASFTGLRWFDGDAVHVNDDYSGSFAAVRTVLSRIGFIPAAEARPLAVHYFSWLAWALLVAVIAAAVVANLPTRAARGFRVVGTLLGLAAAGLTFAAVQLIDVRPGSGVPDAGYGTFLDATGVGFWAAVAGFGLVAAGALLGSRPVRRPLGR